MSRGHYGPELVGLVHRDEHVAQAQQHLHDLIRDVLADAAGAGAIRDDVAPDELATYCRHSLAAAGSLPSEAAVRRLVTLTWPDCNPRRDCDPGIFLLCSFVEAGGRHSRCGARR